MTLLNRLEMPKTNDSFSEFDETSEPLPHLQEMVRSVYSKIKQEEFASEAANVSPGARREMNELRKRFGSGVAERSRPSGENVRGDHSHRGRKDLPPAAKPIALDDVLDALRRASLEPIEPRAESLAWRREPARSVARGDDVFAADKPAKFQSYEASFAVEPYAFIMMKTGRADSGVGAIEAALDLKPAARGNELVVSSNGHPLQILAETRWEGERGNFWDMLRFWFKRLMAPGASATFRQNLFGEGFSPRTLVARLRIGKASFTYEQLSHFTELRALLPRPQADARRLARLSSGGDSPS